jgi:uncharacterized damage-inducible protein DinB
MNEFVLEALRHNAWATTQLLAACRELSDDELMTREIGTYGTVLETLNHLVHADAGYIPRIDGTIRPAWVDSGDSVGIPELRARAEETAHRWEHLVSQEPDASQVLLLDDGAYEAELSILVVQALHHGNAHREQVCSILTALDVEAPDLQGWAYAEATGHARELK